MYQELTKGGVYTWGGVVPLGREVITSGKGGVLFEGRSSFWGGMAFYKLIICSGDAPLNNIDICS